MVSFKHSGNFNNLERFLLKMSHSDRLLVLEQYGKRGVQALSSATPVDSGNTSSMWSYEIHNTSTSSKLVFTNSNMNKGVNIAILLQYGHGTRGGGYVQGRDYINPAIQPIFDQMANDLWKEVTRA